MFDRVLLATDDTQEGLIALREGAILAKGFGADVFLLIVEPASTSANIAATVHMVPSDSSAEELLQRGLERLATLNLRASGVVSRGDPVAIISEQARVWNAELIVIGHRRQSFLDRWWSGPQGAYVVDHVGCSVLIARQVVSDDEFARRLGDIGSIG